MARTTSTYPSSIDTFINATTDFNPGDAIPSSDFERGIDAIKTIQTKLGITGGTALLDSAVTVNNSEADKDFRIAAVGATNAFFVQGSDGFVGIGKNNPSTELDVVGDVTIEAAKLTVGATTPTAAQWGYLGGSSGIDHFVDRGDPGSDDFVVGDLTTDATWRELDLSGIIPVGAVAVSVSVSITDDAVSSYFQLRENGNSNIVNRFTIQTQVADVAIEHEGIVACDANRKIEYRGINLAFTTITVTVKGWWIP